MFLQKNVEMSAMVAEGGGQGQKILHQIPHAAADFRTVLNASGEFSHSESEKMFAEGCLPHHAPRQGLFGEKRCTA